MPYYDALRFLPLGPPQWSEADHRYVVTRQFSLELPMGSVDPGESPAEAARRELYEETALAGGPLYHVGWFFALPGLTSQRVHVFHYPTRDELLDTTCPASAEADLTGTVAVPLGDLPRLVADGRVTDSVTLGSLALAGINLPGAATSTGSM